MAAPITEEQELVLRVWVGEDILLSELQAYYDEFNSFDATVRAVLTKQLTTLIQEPSQITVPGLSISQGQNITALRQLIADFNAAGGTGLDEGVPFDDAIGIGKLVRRIPR